MKFSKLKLRNKLHDKVYNQIVRSKIILFEESSPLKFLNILSSKRKIHIDLDTGWIDKNVSFVTLYHPLLDRPVFLEYPVLFSLLLTFLSCCFALIYLSLDLAEIACLYLAPFDWISKIIRGNYHNENWIIDHHHHFFFFPFFFFHQPTMRYPCTRTHARFIESRLHNVGGILNLYVTPVPGVMKHGRCAT